MIGVYNGRNRLNIREGAGVQHQAVRTLAPGEEVEVFGIENGWAKTSEGYVMASKLDMVAETAVEVEPEIEGEVDGSSVLEGMKVAELRVLAQQSGIKLGANMRKADIIAAIREA